MREVPGDPRQRPPHNEQGDAACPAARRQIVGSRAAVSTRRVALSGSHIQKSRTQAMEHLDGELEMKVKTRPEIGTCSRSRWGAS